MKMSPRSERKKLRKKAQMLDEAIANGSIGSRVPASEPPRQKQLNVWLMYCATAAVQVGLPELSRQLTLHSGVVCDPVQCIAITAVHNVLRSYNGVLIEPCCSSHQGFGALLPCCSSLERAHLRLSRHVRKTEEKCQKGVARLRPPQQ